MSYYRRLGLKTQTYIKLRILLGKKANVEVGYLFGRFITISCYVDGFDVGGPAFR
jgi:hypothetical protein